MNKTKKDVTEENNDVPSGEHDQKQPKFQLAGLDVNDFKVSKTETITTVNKEMTNIPVKIPNSQQFFRVHPELEITVQCVKWREENNRLYLVTPSLIETLLEQSKKYTLHVGMYQTTRTIFLFPVQLPGGNEKWNSWHEAQAEACDKAKNQWIRMEPSREQGGYILHVAQGEIDEPVWPDKTIEEFMAIAFKSSVITDENHVIVKQLRGF